MGVDTLDKELNDDLNERLEQMAEQGEIELEKPEEKVEEPKEKPEAPKSETIDIDGRTLTKSEIAEALRVAENQREFARSNTQKAQELSKKNEELEARKAKIEKIRSVSTGDETLSSVLDIMESVVNDNAKMKEREDVREQALKYQEARTTAELKRKDAIASFKDQGIDVDIPDIDSPEFKKILTVANGVNEIEYAVYKLNKEKFVPRKDKPNLSTTADKARTDVEPEGDDEYDAEQKAFAKKMGVKL